LFSYDFISLLYLVVVFNADLLILKFPGTVLKIKQLMILLLLSMEHLFKIWRYFFSFII